MARLLYDTETATLRPYPRPDDEPVINLDSRYLMMDLIQEAQPDYDPATQRPEPTEMIDLEALTVTRGWQLVDVPPPPPPPDVLGFFSELSRNPAIATPIGDLLSEMMQPRPNPAHAPQAALGLGVGLGQVADKGDPRVFLDAWHQALERGLLGPELIAGVQQLAQVHNLPAEFIAALQPSVTP